MANILNLKDENGNWIPIPAIKGEKGDKGDKGDKGNTGSTGPRGYYYTPSVSNGILSWTNNGGLSNPASTIVTGPRGLQGEQGIQGEVGPQGPQGIQGPVGPKGDQGIQGIQGPTGPVGPTGPQGDSGVYIGGNEPSDMDIKVWISENGDDFIPVANVTETSEGALITLSDYEGNVTTALVKNGPKGEDGNVSFNDLTEAQRESLKGEKGDKGDKGDQGIQGIQGPRGLQGYTGPEGPQGPKGDTGDTGPQGPAFDPNTATYPDLETTDKTLIGSINELFTDVSNGKTLVANAITDKGVETSTDATFATMAANIASITTGAANDTVFVETNIGAVVTATDGTTTLTETCTEGTVELVFPNEGNWNIQSDYSGNVSDIVTVHIPTNYYNLTYNTIFGFTYNNGSTVTRLTPSNDPNGLVNVEITSNAVYATETTEGSSPFNNYAPWNGMEEYNIVDNKIKYKYGDAGFSRTDYDTVVYIPTFYYKRVNNSFYVSNGPAEGFEKHPGSGKYIAKYLMDNNRASKSGTSASEYNGIDLNRTYIQTYKGKDHYHMIDYATWCALWLLHMIEFPFKVTLDAVNNAGVNGSSTSGTTDKFEYHTALTSDGTLKYRNIENYWGKHQFIDGINFYGTSTYICTTPAVYDSFTSTGYTSMDVDFPTSTYGYVTSLGNSSIYPWAFIATQCASSTSYKTYSDWITTPIASSWRCAVMGGNGTMNMACNQMSSSYNCTRFIFNP